MGLLITHITRDGPMGTLPKRTLFLGLMSNILVSHETEPFIIQSMTRPFPKTFDVTLADFMNLATILS